MEKSEIFHMISRQLFGVAPTDTPNNCVRCKKVFSPDILRTPAEQRESKLSGLCGICWDELFKDIELPTMSVQMMRVAETYKARLQTLTEAISSPTVEKVLDVLECHGASFEIGMDKDIRAWTLTIKECQHPAVATALAELNPTKIAVTMKEQVKETWYGMIFEIPEVRLDHAVALIVGLRTKDNDEADVAPAPHKSH